MCDNDNNISWLLDISRDHVSSSMLRCFVLSWEPCPNSVHSHCLVYHSFSLSTPHCNRHYCCWYPLTTFTHYTQSVYGILVLISFLFRSFVYFLCLRCTQSTLRGRRHRPNINVSVLFVHASSLWQALSRALPYWRRVAKCPYFLLFCMPFGPQSSEAEHLHQLFSARWFVVVQWVCSGGLSAAAMTLWSSSGAE